MEHGDKIYLLARDSKCSIWIGLVVVTATVTVVGSVNQKVGVGGHIRTSWLHLTGAIVQPFLSQHQHVF